MRGSQKCFGVVVSVCVGGLLMSSCELRNPVLENKQVPRATSPNMEKAKPVAEQSGEVKEEAAVVTPPSLNREEINKRLREAVAKRKLQQGIQAKPTPLIKNAPERKYTSADFTKIKPDDASTARKPPVAADVKRYTSDLKGDGALMAKLTTSQGEIICELFEEKAPITVANFVGLARGLKAWFDPFTRQAMVGVPMYQNVFFHRVIPDFMIQGGDPEGTGRGNPGYAIADEFDASLRHDSAGILSMANAGANTGGSQFFITEKPTPSLDDRHAVFGKCEPVATVKKIARVERNAMDRPNEDVVLEKVEIYRNKK